jgi:tRNA (guanosine-2'-O-)-methyltransferase
MPAPLFDLPADVDQLSAGTLLLPHDVVAKLGRLYDLVHGGANRPFDGSAPPRSAPDVKTSRSDLAAARRRRPTGCAEHLIVAPLWVAYDANLGSLLRTCDAVRACMAVPATPHYRACLARGDTLTRRPHIHWLDGSKRRWIERERAKGSIIVAVELADDAVMLGELQPATQRTVMLLGHERDGVPDDVWPLIDHVVEIPMVGIGASLNVAVAGSLVLYRLAGLS